MRIHLDEGHDIETPEQMNEVILSSGGVPSLSVTLAQSVTTADTSTPKPHGVSKCSNVAYCKEGLRVWRAYNVGPGKVISVQKYAQMPSISLPSVVTVKTSPSCFSEIKARALSKTKSAKNSNELNDAPNTAAG